MSLKLAFLALFALNFHPSICTTTTFCFPFFYHNKPHLQYKPLKHKITEKFTALIQYKTRYKDPYLQPEECRGKNNKQTKKQIFE